MVEQRRTKLNNQEIASIHNILDSFNIAIRGNLRDAFHDGIWEALSVDRGTLRVILREALRGSSTPAVTGGLAGQRRLTLTGEETAAIKRSQQLLRIALQDDSRDAFHDGIWEAVSADKALLKEILRGARLDPDALRNLTKNRIYLLLSVAESERGRTIAEMLNNVYEEISGQPYKNEPEETLEYAMYHGLGISIKRALSQLVAMGLIMKSSDHTQAPYVATETLVDNFEVYQTYNPDLSVIPHPTEAFARVRQEIILNWSDLMQKLSE